jgi:hypothetical protein
VIAPLPDIPVSSVLTVVNEGRVGLLAQRAGEHRTCLISSCCQLCLAPLQQALEQSRPDSECHHKLSDQVVGGWYKPAKTMQRSDLDSIIKIKLLGTGRKSSSYTGIYIKERKGKVQLELNFESTNAL